MFWDDGVVRLLVGLADLTWSFGTMVLFVCWLGRSFLDLWDDVLFVGWATKTSWFENGVVCQLELVEEQEQDKQEEEC